ncbi:zinc-binding dehydrogenase [Streptomyces sp. 2132.2]|uniref:zinc-binding dehydrogenase n=1 Tax=Streptomyces sp. 2132.2 TaxID=2485161 RepID=UPI0021A291B2|nr:zinc-binding dehydrogenase [Streptomyces sp. 2132.2]
MQHPPKADLVRPLGADEVVDHLREDPADGVHPYDLRTLGGLIESGALPPALDRTYPLAEVPDAVRRLRDGRVRGKIAIRVGGSGHGTRPGAEPAEGG